MYFGFRDNSNNSSFNLKKKFSKSCSSLVKGYKNIWVVGVGDVFKVFFMSMGCVYTFEGTCLAVRSKFFKQLNTSMVLSNFIAGVGVEYVFSYYYNSVYNCKIYDYKSKFDITRKSKLYFLSSLSGSETQV